MIPALGISEIAGGPRFDLGLRPSFALCSCCNNLQTIVLHRGCVDIDGRSIC